MRRDDARALLDRLHAAQGAFYAGGPRAERAAAQLRDSLLTADIAWHVPGRNAIAGTYRGIEEVMDYFARRRDLVSASLRLHPGDLLVGDGDRVAMLTDGTAVVAGAERRWSTVGLYRLSGDRVAECWLLPLDADLFDEVWAG